MIKMIVTYTLTEIHVGEYNVNVTQEVNTSTTNTMK